jgi:hypothetical protein
MRTLLAGILVCWAFLVAPGLCGAGLLSHACICDEAQDCTHEELCSQDPCGKLSVRSGSADQTRIADRVGPALPPTPVFIGAGPDFVPGIEALVPRPSSKRNLPIPSADLPLLI